MGRIVIDDQKCKGCFLCVDVCPEKIIFQGAKLNNNGYYSVVFDENSNKCIGCALCAMSCPDIAIKEVYK